MHHQEHCVLNDGMTLSTASISDRGAVCLLTQIVALQGLRTRELQKLEVDKNGGNERFVRNVEKMFSQQKH